MGAGVSMSPTSIEYMKIKEALKDRATLNSVPADSSALNNISSFNFRNIKAKCEYVFACALLLFGVYNN
jgi:hypothetical protein